MTRRSAPASGKTRSAARGKPAKAQAGPPPDLEQQLAEALAQQAATSEILRMIRISPADAQPVFEMIVDRAMRLCGALHGGVLTFDGELLHVAAHVASSREFSEAVRRIHPRPPSRGTAAARAVLTRATVHIPDVETDPDYEFTDAAREAGFRSTLAAPMLRDGRAIGAIVVFGSGSTPFSERHVRLLETFADQAVIAIENVRLFTEVQERNRALTEALDQQTAMSEILRVISSSPTDVQPVSRAIVENARELCGADSAAVLSHDGGMVHLEALDNANTEQASALRAAYPTPANRGHATGRAILAGRPVHIPDIWEDPEYAMDTLRDTAGLRSVLSVPMIRDGIPLGAITVQRWGAPRPFSDEQIALLRTFADQAVIAIENVRLFSELEARNRELTETLDQQTATSEVLKVISRSTFDLGTGAPDAHRERGPAVPGRGRSDLPARR